MKLDYKEILNLEDIASDAASYISNGYSVFNNYLAYEFDVQLITQSGLSDVTEDAKGWAADTCPDSLHFNHGSYLKGGMKHLIDELKNKPSGNRALLSLISQEHISNSGDKPIPSFMVLQSSIDDNILYCTTYFRALEVSTFLRINIEEIRQRLCTVYSECQNFNKIRLVIFSFRAYHNSSMIPLKKPAFDLLTPYILFQKLDDSPKDLGNLIREKSKDSTVVYLEQLLHLKEALEDGRGNLPNVDLILKHLKDSLYNGEQLEKIRLLQSHHPVVKEKADKLSNSLIQLAKEFDKCH